MAKSVKVNFIYNLLNTVVGLLFPLITIPYVSRIVMADGIGKVNFLQSIINYVALMTALGIPLYAVRQIAKVRDDIKERNKQTIEIFLLHSLLTLAGYVIVFILSFSVNRIYKDIWLFFLLSAHLVLSVIGVQWFYQAVEDFKYITIRSLIVRVCCLIFLFTFVRDKSDLYAYGFYCLANEVGNYIFNFIHLKSYLHKTDYRAKELNIFRHLKPALHIFVLNLITSIYVNLDTVMLGFMQDDSSVGYYTNSIRISKVLIGVVAALGTVLLPRFSNQVENGNIKEFERTSGLAIKIILLMAIPMAVGLIFTAPNLVMVLCGEGFIPAIMTLKIVAPIVIFLGMSSFIGLQVLYSQNKENIVIISTLCGAIINFSLNLILIPFFSQNGAALATVIAEGTVTISMLIIGRKFIPFSVLDKNTVEIIIASVVMIVPIVLLRNLQINPIILLCLILSTSCLVYFSALFLMKNSVTLQIKDIIFNKIQFRNKK